jgi:hypothetical protein
MVYCGGVSMHRSLRARKLRADTTTPSAPNPRADSSSRSRALRTAANPPAGSPEPQVPPLATAAMIAPPPARLRRRPVSGPLTQSRPPPKIRRKNRNTFSASRKMDAAISGAEVMSLDRRSRWKSPIVSAAKITSPMIA